MKAACLQSYMCKSAWEVRKGVKIVSADTPMAEAAVLADGSPPTYVPLNEHIPDPELIQYLTRASGLCRPLW